MNAKCQIKRVDRVAVYGAAKLGDRYNPYVVVTSSTYRQVRAAALHLASEVELRSEDHRWIVRTCDRQQGGGRFSCSVELELAQGTEQEVVAGLAVLTSACLLIRSKLNDSVDG